MTLQERIKVVQREAQKYSAMVARGQRVKRNTMRLAAADRMLAVLQQVAALPAI